MHLYIITRARTVGDDKKLIIIIAHPHRWVCIQKISLSSRARKKQKAKNELKLLESYLVAKWTEENFFRLNTRM